MNYSQIISGVYIILIFIAFLMEMSYKIDTDHILKKIGLWLIAMGSILHIGGSENHLVPIGLSLYFGIILLRAFMNKYGRRTSDRRALNGDR